MPSRLWGQVIAGVHVFSPPRFWHSTPRRDERTCVMLVPAGPMAPGVVRPACLALTALQARCHTMGRLGHAGPCGPRCRARPLGELPVDFDHACGVAFAIPEHAHRRLMPFLARWGARPHPPFDAVNAQRSFGPITDVDRRPRLDGPRGRPRSETVPGARRAAAPDHASRCGQGPPASTAPPGDRVGDDTRQDGPSRHRRRSTRAAAPRRGAPACPTPTGVSTTSRCGLWARPPCPDGQGLASPWWAGTAAWPPGEALHPRQRPRTRRRDRGRPCPAGRPTGAPRPPRRAPTWPRRTERTPTRPRRAPRAPRLGASVPGARAHPPTEPRPCSVAGAGGRVRSATRSMRRLCVPHPPAVHAQRAGQARRVPGGRRGRHRGPSRVPTGASHLVEDVGSDLACLPPWWLARGLCRFHAPAPAGNRLLREDSRRTFRGKDLGQVKTC